MLPDDTDCTARIKSVYRIGLERCGLDTASTDFDSPSYSCIPPEHHQASSKRGEVRAAAMRHVMCLHVCQQGWHVTQGFSWISHGLQRPVCDGILLAIRTSCSPGRLKMSQLKLVLRDR